MLGAKNRHYEGNNTDLAILKTRIEEYLNNDVHEPF